MPGQTTAARPPTPVAPQVLLVCTANICRSPMAEALWQDSAAGRPEPPSVGSAGMEAEPGRPPDSTCVELMAARGLDISAHRASRFRADVATGCELILVMEPAHARRIQALAPQLAGRVQLLGRWTSGSIRDPYRRPQAAYEMCLSALEESVRAWLNKLP